MNKFVFLFLLVLVFVPLVSSELSPCGSNNDFIGKFERDTIFQLKQTCDTCSYVYLDSLTLTNGTVIDYSLATMDKFGNTYSYNYSNNDIGCYNINVCGDKDGGYKCESLDFQIGTTTISQTTSQSIGSLGFLFVMLILMFVFGYIGIKLLKHETLWVLGIFLVFLSVLLLIYNTWLGYEYHRLLTGLSDSSVPEVIFYIFLFILVLGLLIGVAFLILNWKKVFKYFKSELKKKDKDDSDVEDWDLDKYSGHNR